MASTRKDNVVFAARKLSDVLAEFPEYPEAWCECVHQMDEALMALDADLAAARREGAEISDAARDVLAERRRQIEAEGWKPEGDDLYVDGELGAAAAAYAVNAVGWTHRLIAPLTSALWPWSMNWWKPTDPRRDLVKAGALILAELDRLDRAAIRAGGKHDG